MTKGEEGKACKMMWREWRRGQPAWILKDWVTYSSKDPSNGNLRST